MQESEQKETSHESLEASITRSEQNENNQEQVEPSAIVAVENPMETLAIKELATDSNLSEQDRILDTSLGSPMDGRAISAQNEESAAVIKVKKDDLADVDNEAGDKTSKSHRGNFIMNRDALRQLTFIATPANKPKVEEYSYPGSSYFPVIIYFLGSGADERHTDFISPSERKLITSFIYTADVPPAERQTTDMDKSLGWGTCVLSLICGRRPGVFKEPAKVVVIKSSSTLRGLLSGYQGILNEYNPQNALNVRGKVVLSVHELMPDDQTVLVDKIKNIVRILVNHFGIVVLSPADTNNGNPRIKGYPSAMVYDEPAVVPVIVTGAVDLVNGELHETTRVEKVRAVLYPDVGAPGSVQCSRAGGSHQDTRILGAQATASALTAGVVALLLADKKIGGAIRKNPEPARMMKGCILDLAQQRGQSIKSIWTDVNPAEAGKNYE